MQSGHVLLRLSARRGLDRRTDTVFGCGTVFMPTDSGQFLRRAMAVCSVDSENASSEPMPPLHAFTIIAQPEKGLARSVV